MKILGIDHGLKRIGLATGNTETKIATAFGLIEVESDDKTIEKIKTLIATEAIDLVVVGLPLGISGQATTQSKIVDDFVKNIQTELSIEVKTIDERYSSFRADDAIAEGSKKSRDELAALYLLQDYLDKSV